VARASTPVFTTGVVLAVGGIAVTTALLVTNRRRARAS